MARKNGQPPGADNKQKNRDLRNELSISRELGRLHPSEHGSHGDTSISAQSDPKQKIFHAVPRFPTYRNDDIIHNIYRY